MGEDASAPGTGAWGRLAHYQALADTSPALVAQRQLWERLAGASATGQRTADPRPGSYPVASARPGAGAPAPRTVVQRLNGDGGAGLTIPQRVARAMSLLGKDAETTEEAVMAALVKEWDDRPEDLVAPSKTPEFAEALLEAIRGRQAPKWVDATRIKPASERFALPGDPARWTVRHYTNKATVTLGPPPAEGGPRPVVAVDPPPFDELLSMVTLSAIALAGRERFPLDLREDQRLHTNASSKKSGHTSGLDWKNIGNVGDTFYALFYDGESATGTVPAFITDALYYVEWSLAEFGEGWASSDWLATAAESRKEGGKVPSGEAVGGNLARVVAHQLGLKGVQAKVLGGDREGVKRTAATRFGGAFENFEVKKHGSLRFERARWVAANAGKIAEIRGGSWDAKAGWTAGRQG